MIKALKNLLGLAAREDATTDELAPSLPAAEAELAAAHEAAAAADAAYRSGLLTAGEAALLQLDAARREAAVRIERAEALVSALRERLETAREREAEVARVEVYENAKRLAAEGREALALYPQAAQDLVTILTVIAEAELAVAQANADRPRGAEPIPAVEHAVRDVPTGPDEVISEVEVQRWVRVGDIVPGTFDQQNVHDLGQGRGVIRYRNPGLPLADCPQVERRTFIEQHVQPGHVGAIAYALAERIALPGFRPGDPDIWRPLTSPSIAGDVLKQVAALRSPGHAAAAPGATTTRLVATPGAKPVEEVPVRASGSRAA
jgi:hypothetical protein